MMIQYIKDTQALDAAHLDTLQFNVQVHNDSLFLSNLYHPEKRTSWKKIGNVDTFAAKAFTSIIDYRRYALEFKERYEEAVLTQMPDTLVQRYSEYFDRDWNIKE